MSATTLIDTATELAYLVRTETPAAVAHAIQHGINPADKNALIVLLAGLIDIDRTHRELAEQLQASPLIGAAIDRLTVARVESYRPAYEAWLHGDRDPQVVAHAMAYAQQLGEGVPSGP